MWQIGGAAILTGLLQFSIGFVTVAFVGHLGVVELAAVSIAQNVIEGFAYGILVIDRSMKTVILMIQEFSIVFSILLSEFSKLKGVTFILCSSFHYSHPGRNSK